MCLFSIVVVSYNAEDGIKTTINSILSQTEKDYEIIVKDALSTDKTIQLIPDSENIKVYSMKDSGIYDGMNQGISFSNGQYLIFMNCGDLFYDSHVLENIKKTILTNNDRPLVIYGDLYTIGTIIHQPKKMTVDILRKNPICHQSVFFAKQIFEICGEYDISYRLMADYDLYFRILMHDIDMCHVDTVVCSYENNGESVSKRNRELIKRENQVILSNYFSQQVLLRDKIVRIITMSSFRSWIDSEEAPQFLRKSYKRIVEFIKSDLILKG